MLASAHRITDGLEYRTVVRRGVRSVGPHTVTYVRARSESSVDPVRFGFIVAKNVGSAVARNTVRRRLKAISHELIPVVPDGAEVVIRALPGSLETPWAELRGEVERSVRSASRRAAGRAS